MEAKEGYDSSATTYSPDGRLYQVEYARKAISRGSISVGVVYKDGVVLLVNKRADNRLIEVDKIEKMSQLAPKVGCTSSGLIADARVLVDEIRDLIQNDKFMYGEVPDIPEMATDISDMIYSLTLDGGMRLFGVALLIGGMDKNGPHLFITDPSGAYRKVMAGAIGRGADQVEEKLEEIYKPDLCLEEALDMGIDMVIMATEGNASPDTMEICIIDDDGFEVMEPGNLKKAYKKAKC